MALEQTVVIVKGVLLIVWGTEKGEELTSVKCEEAISAALNPHLTVPHRDVHTAVRSLHRRSSAASASV